MDDDPGHVLDTERPGVALDADVLEAVGGVAGLEPVLGIAPRDHGVHLAGGQRLAGGEVERLEVLGRDLARLVEQLAVDERRGGAVRAEVLQADPPVDVLAEVDDVVARGEAADRHRTQLLDPPDRWRRRGREHLEGAVDHGGLGPGTVVEARPVPAIVAAVEVDGLAVDQVGA